MPISATEEDYLKTIYKLAEKYPQKAHINTNSIAQKMNTKAASVTDMLKRLADKKLVDYQRYKGGQLTPLGKDLATNLVRKHRLWEVFLLEKLGFKWDEVHDIAEQLEHIHSKELINRLEVFLEFPKFDPHGDPIPDRDGNIAYAEACFLSDLKEQESGIIVGVCEDNSSFLHYLEAQKLILGVKVHLIKRFEYDNSLEVLVDDARKITISQQVSRNLYVKV